MRNLKMFRRSKDSVPVLSTSIDNAWSPSRGNAGLTFSNSNKTVSRTSGGGVWNTLYAAANYPSTRKSVFEVSMDAFSSIPTVLGFSTASNITAYSAGYPGGFANTGGVDWAVLRSAAIYNGVGVARNPASLGKAGEYSIGEVAGILHDPNTGYVYLAKNGILLNAGSPVWILATGLIITPAIAQYNTAKATLRSGTGALKYKYGDYSTVSDGGITPGQGTAFFNPATKHANSVLYNDNRMISNDTAIGSYQTCFTTQALPSTKKTVFEFILANASAFSLCGLYFGADRTGPKAGVLGQTLASSLGLDLFSSGGGSVTGNGCTRTVTTIGATGEGDVMAFGYDPVAKTVVMWKNGVPLNSGNPIWTGVNSLHADGGVIPGVTLNHINGRVRLNPDLPSYDYGTYTV